MKLTNYDKKYLNKLIRFPKETGCIPSGSVCFCLKKEGPYYWVQFKYPILGMNQIRVHEDVIANHGTIVN